MDYMLVKSIKSELHVSNLWEEFECMRQQIFWLNPSKYAFGVKSRKYLGFKVSEREIEVNPKN